MQNDKMEDGEWLSALADGQLQGENFARAMAALAASDAARLHWHAYHVAGDILRCSDLADCRGDRSFVMRLRTRLALSEEPERLDVAVSAVGMAAPSSNAPTLVPVLASANDADMRWKWLAAAASVVAVATMGWHLSQVGAGTSAQLALTAAGNGVVATNVAQPSIEEPPRMLRDPRLDELLAAHRQLGGTSALQMPAGFLRNATFEQLAR